MDSATPLHIHLLSFDPAEKHARKLIASNHSTRNTLTFHSLGELMLFTEISQNGLIDRHGPAALLRKGGLKSYRFLAELFGFNPDCYVGIYERILEIMGIIKPRVHIAAVDLCMPIGMDACMTANVPWGILCPNSGLELSKHEQPMLKGFWRYPAPYSGFAFPVPLHLIPYNIALNIAWLRTLQTHPRIRTLEARRAKAGIRGQLLDKPLRALPFLICASVCEMEFPHVPGANVVYPGPIVVVPPPLAPGALADFLARARTLVVNMGSNFWYTEADVAAVADAVVLARERCPVRFQVLWKLNGKKAFEGLLEERLGKELLEDVRTEEWIEPPALAVLQHPNVVALVNHGGANSVHEAAYSGVPQIILPQWLDLYDYAVRVEWLGHGIYANKGHAAKIHAPQLADAFVRVLSDGEGTAMKKKALEIAEACRRGGGVGKVAQTLLSAARSAA
ncbi:glycosyltransferase family 1 protein [Phanerochaete sordida]|uniref:Glycosyltransferase family 1 protein n=1 Tax=Phanerochaete sordida TaxID=48140 RepID=A0A9P3GDL7_9APHY|nr:glycosyltransferase family 1 protein [Phanerochaete sordida]